GEVTIRYPTSIPTLLDEAVEMIHHKAGLRADGSPRKTCYGGAFSSPASFTCIKSVGLPCGMAKHVIGGGGAVIQAIEKCSGTALRVEVTRTIPEGVSIVIDADKQCIVREILHVSGPSEAEIDAALKYVENWMHRVHLRERIQRPRGTALDDDASLL